MLGSSSSWVKLRRWRCSSIGIICGSKFDRHSVFSFCLISICFLTELRDRKLGRLAIIIIVGRLILCCSLDSISFLTELRDSKLRHLIIIVVWRWTLSCTLYSINFLTKLGHINLLCWRCSTTVCLVYLSWISVLRLRLSCFCLLTKLRHHKRGSLTLAIWSCICLSSILCCVLSCLFLLSKLWQRHILHTNKWLL